MKCPYDNKECDQIDTSGMTKLKKCEDCERYNHGARLTGAFPDINKGCLYAFLFSAIIWIIIIFLIKIL